ncbi:MAG TPA: carboxypeptidase-like regulatory domain-containing protein [Paludibacter sp.]|nr:carboxypeptidase-like regulatory domain-containing protein [Paludibacter sp.]
MKTVNFKFSLFPKGVVMSMLLTFFTVLGFATAPSNFEIVEFKGVVIDRDTKNPLPFANIYVSGTNISTVSNTDGEFIIKVDNENLNEKIIFKFIGYKNKVILLSEFVGFKGKVELEPISVELPEVSVISKDAEALVQAMIDKRNLNYSKQDMQLTAFYRETIKKNKTYVSLSEAVVDIFKQPYNSYKLDVVKMYKARKQADYTKLDTVVFKLMGGPFNSLYLDIMKYPEMFFTNNMTDNYLFSFDRSTKMDNRLIYVIDFKQKSSNTDPLYFGKLYIDAQNLAMKSAVFNLNIQNKEEASKMFIIKKPLNAKVFPVTASYRIDYFEKDGLWYYGYSRIELGLKIDWKKKFFNTTYFSTIEMATTDYQSNDDAKPANYKERLKPSVIVSDEATGFSDPNFWGEFNVIEPEKSIESAIKKIQKQLEKK